MKKSCMDSEKEDKMIIERIKISEDNQSNVSQITEPMIVEKIEISEDNASNVSQMYFSSLVYGRNGRRLNPWSVQ